MAKGIILVNVPETCKNCLFSGIHRTPIGDQYFCRILIRGVIPKCKKPEWCPIKPMPEKANHPYSCDWGRYDKGWNDCLEEIEGSDKQ